MRSIVCAVMAAASVLTGAAGADWLSVPSAPVFDGEVRSGARAADGTSWFATTLTNAAPVRRAVWTVSGLGTFEAYVNGLRVGDDFLKPGFTHWAKTKYAFAYDVTDLLRTDKGACNCLAAEVGAGWWRDKIVTPIGNRGFTGRKSAFRGELTVEYADGTRVAYGTNTNDWRCGIAGPVTHSGIFDGETYDARLKAPTDGTGLAEVPEVNREFSGEVVTCVRGAEAACPVLRRDLAMVRGPLRVGKGETVVVDFGQNCAAVPEFRFRARTGTVLTALPGEILNDAEKGVRGSDGPVGSVHRKNLRAGRTGMRIDYTFAGGGTESYLPRFTYFGYRYLTLTATDDVEIESVASIPVSSVRPEMEAGSLEVGDARLNRFVQNVRWSLLSNYLSVPTDCPQRSERLGWTADAQVFCETGAYLTDVREFFRKYARDQRDSVGADGGYTSVAPFAQYGNETFIFGWADAGVIIPYRVWKAWGDCQIVEENYVTMARFVRRVDETKYDFEGQRFLFSDWLSYERYETAGNAFGGWKRWKTDPDARDYRRFLACCFWLQDARMMSEMASALGKPDDAAEFRGSAERALRFVREHFVEPDGLLLKPMRDLQTASVFALRFGIVEGEARERTLELLRQNIRAHGGCLQTGFLGTAYLMDALADCGDFETAYGLLLQDKDPSWLFAVDQGATTLWERWNSYSRKDGIATNGKTSFNHYAYGSVLAWMFRHVAGISADPSVPGFRRLVLAPRPDRRLGSAKAEYRSAAGRIASAWRYEGETLEWDFTIPEGATASVLVPGEREMREFAAGSHRVQVVVPECPDWRRETNARSHH